MEQTAIKPGVPPGASTAIKELEPAAPRPAREPKPAAQRILEAAADLRITVFLFVLAMLLVFWGTLAQVDNGVWTVVKHYFRSFFVWVPLKVILFNGISDTSMAIPFPGGWAIGTAMLINLLAAHAIRFKMTWNRSGIHLIHAGIIIMMLGEYVTGIYAIEGQMMIKTGQTQNAIIHTTEAELAIIKRIDNKTDEAVTIPARRLQTGAEVTHDDIPFKIVVENYMVNSALLNGGNRIATQGFGKQHGVKELPEVSGVDPDQKIDMPSAHVTLFDLQGKALGTWLFSTWFDDPQWITVDKEKYQVSLRLKTKTRPFTIRLDKFQHDVFPGTEKPKDFRSFVHISDPEEGVELDVQIYMNTPLYYRGETFYQSSWTTDPMTGKANGTVLQVVRNPGWLLPYVSCGVVGIGLLIHFGLTLYRFIDRRIVR